MSSVVSFLSINFSPHPYKKNNNYTPTNCNQSTEVLKSGVSLCIHALCSKN